MTHPNKSEVEDSHNAKLRRMTTHYGEADPKANFKAPSEKYKLEGPEPHVGFGADNAAVSARSDKPARRAVAANPIATYKRGGKVKKDSGGAVDAIEQANENQSQASRARGGRLHHKGKGSTHVNVMIAPQGAGAAPPALPPQLAGAMPKPPMAPPPGPPMPPPGAGGPPGMPPGGPGGAPPMMRKRGGKVHADEAQDKALIKKELKDEGLIRKARGGALHLPGGVLSGPGRAANNKFQKSHGDKSKPIV